MPRQERAPIQKNNGGSRHLLSGSHRVSLHRAREDFELPALMDHRPPFWARNGPTGVARLTATIGVYSFGFCKKTTSVQSGKKAIFFEVFRTFAAEKYTQKSPSYFHRAFVSRAVFGLLTCPLAYSRGYSGYGADPTGPSLRARSVYM